MAQSTSCWFLPVKYADRWREYVKSELRGQTGLSVFMEKMKLDETSFKQLSDEYWRYARWVNKKMSLKATISKRVIPWDKQKNRRGEVSGEKKDDLLPEVAPADIPPWDRDTIGGKSKKGN